MSESPSLIGAPRQNARVRGLGDAVPVFTKPKGPREPDPTPKTSDELRAEAQERRDAAPLTVRCALCGWSMEGTAGEGREAAKAHRLKEHPEVKPVRRKRDNLSALRPQNDAESKAEAMVLVEQRRAFTARSEASSKDTGPSFKELGGESVSREAQGVETRAVGSGLRATPLRSSPPRYISPQQHALLDYLASGPKQLNAIAEHHGESVQSSCQRLRGLAGRGLVVKQGRGVYALPAEERAA